MESYRIVLRSPEGRKIEMRYCTTDSQYADFCRRHSDCEVVSVTPDPMPTPEAVTMNGRYSCD